MCPKLWSQETEETETVEEEMAEDKKEDLGEDRGEDDDEVAVDDWEGMEKRIKNLEDAVADLKETKRVVMMMLKKCQKKLLKILLQTLSL